MGEIFHIRDLLVDDRWGREIFSNAYRMLFYLTYIITFPADDLFGLFFRLWCVIMNPSMSHYKL